MASPLGRGTGSNSVPLDPAQIVKVRSDLPADFVAGDHITLVFVLDRYLTPLERRTLGARRPESWDLSREDLERTIRARFAAELAGDEPMRVQDVLNEVHSTARTYEREADTARSNVHWQINEWGLD